MGASWSPPSGEPDRDLDLDTEPEALEALELRLPDLDLEELLEATEPAGEADLEDILLTAS